MRKKATIPPLANPRSVSKLDVDLGHLIRLRRVEQNMSQAELGALLGVSFQQIQKYEKGLNRLGANRLQAIANALDVPMTFFFDVKQKNSEVQTLLFNDSAFTLRLLRAYNALDEAVARRFVGLMETVAGIEG